MKKKQIEGVTLDSYKDAYDKEFKFHDENDLMLSWYTRIMLRSLKERGVQSLLSLGIGQKVVARQIVSTIGDVLREYSVIEGSNEILDDFRRELGSGTSIHLINSLFETFESDKKFDAMEMGFILEHVDDPSLILRKYSGLLNEDGFIIIAVPNARSLHRLIGYEAGLLDDLYRLSEHDLRLGHKRYFDRQSLHEIIGNAGLKVVKEAGIYLKPLTTSQMKTLGLSPAIIKAFCSVGAAYPDICNSIYVEAVPQSA